MSNPFVWPGRRAAGVVTAAAALTLAVVPSAFARTGVFGGSTKAGEGIVLKTDAKARKLKSAVIAWEAACDDGRYYAVALEVTATRREPGFSPKFDDLIMSRNANGRFRGTEVAGQDLGDQSAAISVSLSGKLKGRKASGVLSATVDVVDEQSGQTRATCKTGAVGWSAARAVGRVYGGKTAQEEPVVVRLAANRTRVADILIGWHSTSCQPPEGFLRFGEHFRDFALQGGRFGDSFEQSFDGDDGGKARYSYDLGGTVGSTKARGTFRAQFTRTDAAGTTTATCDSGAVTWTAATG